jgi:membrane fusion protein, multidrug efflux system
VTAVDTKVFTTQTKKPMAGRMILMILLTVLVLGVVLAWQMIPYMLGMGGEQGGGPAPTVSTIVARFEEWQPKLQVVGSLSPVQGADLAFETPGVVERIYFESGGAVRAGTPLVSLRRGDDAARLRTLQATAKLAETNYNRARRLWTIKGISRQQVEEYAAALAAARAQVAEAMAMLNKKVMRAPFAGSLGIRRVNVGDFINAGVPVITLQALDPIFLDFTVPQQKVAQLKPGQAVQAHFDAYPGVTFSGQVTTVDPKADTVTRNVSVRATFQNADRRLVPGMYASAEIHIGAQQQFLTLPQTAVTFNPFGTTAYVIVREKPKGGPANAPPQLIARQRFITTGDTRGDQIQVLSGLKAGEEVVTSGQIKIQNGSTVAINNKVQPRNDPNPQPVEQ